MSVKSHASPLEPLQSQTNLGSVQSLTIDAQKPATLNLHELWDYRELLYFLAWRDIKVRYKQTVMGAAWAVLQPFFTMIVFTVLFGRFAHVPSEGVPYPVLSYSGLLLWTFFANAVVNSNVSLVASANLITKVYFPRMMIPAAAVVAGLLDLGIASLLLIILAAYYDVVITLKALLMPFFILLTFVLALSIGMWTSALTVKYRDIRHALPFVVQLWMFASPVIYPLSIVQGKWRWLLALNPLTGIIESFRAALFGRPFDWPLLTLSVVLTISVFFCSLYAFRKIEESFADLI